MIEVLWVLITVTQLRFDFHIKRIVNKKPQKNKKTEASPMLQAQGHSVIVREQKIPFRF